MCLILFSLCILVSMYDITYTKDTHPSTITTNVYCIQHSLIRLNNSSFVYLVHYTQTLVRIRCFRRFRNFLFLCAFPMCSANSRFTHRKCVRNFMPNLIERRSIWRDAYQHGKAHYWLAIFVTHYIMYFGDGGQKKEYHIYENVNYSRPHTNHNAMETFTFHHIEAYILYLKLRYSTLSEWGKKRAHFMLHQKIASAKMVNNNDNHLLLTMLFNAISFFHNHKNSTHIHNWNWVYGYCYDCSIFVYDY